MTAQTAQALPECSSCGNPMRRLAHAKQDGTCRSCLQAKRRAAAQAAVIRRIP